MDQITTWSASTPCNHLFMDVTQLKTKIHQVWMGGIWFWFGSAECFHRIRGVRHYAHTICHQRIWWNMDPWWTKSQPELLLHHAIIFLWMSHNSNKAPSQVWMGDIWYWECWTMLAEDETALKISHVASNCMLHTCSLLDWDFIERCWSVSTRLRGNPCLFQWL